MGSLDQPHTFTYAPDFGRFLALLGMREDALGRAWHVPSAEPITQRRLLKALEEEIGRPVQARSAPAWLLRLMGLFNPVMGEMDEMLYEWTQPFIMDSSLAQRTFGLAPTPTQEQLRQTVAWVRAH